MAKVAGADSELLQVSSDERARAAGIAELFSEEDLTRHLQIMLRTHGELGYRQEQRFHLELGLVKMSHAQRILPLEQLLSGALPAGGTPSGPAALRPAAGQSASPTISAPPVRRAPEPPRSISPFAADSARKGPFGKPEMSADTPGPRALPQSSPSEPSTGPTPFGHSTPGNSEAVIMGSAAPAAIPQTSIQPRPEFAGPEVVRAEAVRAEIVPAKVQAVIQTEVQSDAQSDAHAETTPAAASPGSELSPEDLGAAVSGAVETAGHPMAATLLSSGRWFFEGNQPAVQVAASEFTVKMTLGAEPLKAANAAASRALGRPTKLRISGGGEANGTPNGKPARKTGASTSRVAEDPIVQKMQEVFGAEIRTVIDYQNKK
jgi:DNA polymerase-3 subunit gamma/tau